MPLKTTTRRQWNGQERQLVRKLQNAIASISARDDRMQAKAAEAGVDGYYFAPDDTAPVALALQTIMDRCDEVIAARV